MKSKMNLGNFGSSRQRSFSVMGGVLYHTKIKGKHFQIEFKERTVYAIKCRNMLNKRNLSIRMIIKIFNNI